MQRAVVALQGSEVAVGQFRHAPAGTAFRRRNGLRQHRKARDGRRNERHARFLGSGDDDFRFGDAPGADLEPQRERRGAVGLAYHAIEPDAAGVRIGKAQVIVAPAGKGGPQAITGFQRHIVFGESDVSGKTRLRHLVCRHCREIAVQGLIKTGPVAGNGRCRG